MVLIMNKSDIKLLICLLVIILIIFIFINVTKKEGNMAEVYYEDDLILNIDLNIDGEYVVDGALGEVVLEVKNKKIRVKSENSPRNICSKEGFVSDNSKSLICLPNKIIVKIIGENELDGVVY